MACTSQQSQLPVDWLPRTQPASPDLVVGLRHHHLAGLSRFFGGETGQDGEAEPDPMSNANEQVLWWITGKNKISFGGIPNNSSIILMPRLTTLWAPFFLRSGSAHVDNVITKRCSKQSHGCPWQGCKATNHTVTLRNLPNPASGTYTSAHRNSPEPASGTYGSIRQNSPEPSGSWLRNLQ